MVAGKGDRDRHVVPRWRSVRRTLEAGEFQRLPEARPLDAAHVLELEAIERRWLDEYTEMAAAEYVGAALVAGVPLQAETAASVLALSDNPLFRQLAERFEGATTSASGVPQPSPANSSASLERMFERAASAKARTIRDPMNAIAWADLARRYTVLGELDRADRSLKVARALAPESRYLLRVATRFYLHRGQPDRAVRMLQDSVRTSDDPWLLAAVLAAQSVAGRPPSGVRSARRVLEDQRFRQIEMAELSSELGTLELAAGKDRRARQLFRESLGDPTDNSLAQAEWASHRVELIVPLDSLEVPFAAEAHARSLAQEGKWTAALTFGLEWLDDQPFDTHAASFASYVASVGLDEWELSKEIAQAGLRANPRDPILLNNLAYAELELGNVPEAAASLARISTPPPADAESAAVTATKGLLAFRQGDVEAGRSLYQRATQLARRSGSNSAAATARAMWLGEELRAGTAGIDELLAEVRNLSESKIEPGTRRCVERALGLLGGPGTDPSM